MQRLTVNLPGRAYDIAIARGLLDQAGELLLPVLSGNKLAVVCDSTTAALFGPRVLHSLAAAGYDAHVVSILAGEASKSLATLESLYQACAALGLTRTDAVVALGGGVVGDVAGFAAATMLRGIDFIQIPTTLLAQVDSSVGGKVAINLPEGKNLVGAFHQPRCVLIDPDCLDTLPARVFADGMAEVIKYGAIFSRPLFERLLAHPDTGSLHPLLAEVIYECCALKRDVVMADEHDTGERQVLNFGHTLGHAYERAHGYLRYTHGEAVAAGMCAISAYSEQCGLTRPGTRQQIAELCAAWGLPTSIACPANELSAAIGLDKKGSGADISLILLREIGQAFIHTVSKSALLEELI